MLWILSREHAFRRINFIVGENVKRHKPSALSFNFIWNMLWTSSEPNCNACNDAHCHRGNISQTFEESSTPSQIYRVIMIIIIRHHTWITPFIRKQKQKTANNAQKFHFSHYFIKAAKTEINSIWWHLCGVDIFRIFFAHIESNMSFHIWRHISPPIVEYCARARAHFT